MCESTQRQLTPGEPVRYRVEDVVSRGTVVSHGDVDDPDEVIIQPENTRGRSAQYTLDRGQVYGDDELRLLTSDLQDVINSATWYKRSIESEIEAIEESSASA